MDTLCFLCILHMIVHFPLSDVIAKIVEGQVFAHSSGRLSSRSRMPLGAEFVIMGKDELKKRAIWQADSGSNAVIAEQSFFDVFSKEFRGSDFRIRSKPTEFRNIYSQIHLSEGVLAQIYNPQENWMHGIRPDYAIDNEKTKKRLYVEVKRQDGWVEGKPRSAGRGNAHERSCKFFTPGLLRILRARGKLGDDVLPFWVVFQGDIARDPKRVREVTCWYEGHSAHFLMWSDSADTDSLISHFNDKLKHLLM